MASDFIERFKPDEIRPAPLVRAGSQEAEQALTRAIYDRGVSPEEELKAAMDKAREVTSDLTSKTARLADATEKLVEKRSGGGFFNDLLVAVGIGQ